MVEPVVRSRLNLVQVVIPVIALVLRAVGQCGCGVQIIRRVLQRVTVERIRDGLPWAVHVRNSGYCSFGTEALVSGAAEALSPCIPTAGGGAVDQGQSRSSVSGRAFLVEVDGDAGNQRLPEVLEELTGIVEGPGGTVHDVTADTTVFSHNKRLLAPIDDVELAETALPGFRRNRARINSAGGLHRGGAPGDSLRRHGATGNARFRALGISEAAVHGTRHAESGGQRVSFGRVQDG